MERKCCTSPRQKHFMKLGNNLPLTIRKLRMPLPSLKDEEDMKMREDRDFDPYEMTEFQNMPPRMAAKEIPRII